jgi:hypothetical protein
VKSILYLVFSLTDEALVGQVFPPSGGFWELGALEGDNIWANATNIVMAPFDQRVRTLFLQ